MKDTFIPSKLDLKQQWYIIDAKDKCLGRLATEVSNLLRGKNKTMFTPAQDVGDYIIIVNACLLYTSPSPRDRTRSRMPSSA